MADVSSTMAYAIADTLAMELYWDAKEGKLHGIRTRVLQFGDLQVPMNVEIIDSKVADSKTTVLVKVMGNLMLLVTASLKRVRVYVINAARYDGNAQTILADMPSLREHKEIVASLNKGLVRVYESAGMSKTNWNEIPLAA